jgi:hypothetical protein
LIAIWYIRSFCTAVDALQKPSVIQFRRGSTAIPLERPSAPAWWIADQEIQPPSLPKDKGHYQHFDRKNLSSLELPQRRRVASFNG